MPRLLTFSIYPFPIFLMLFGMLEDMRGQPPLGLTTWLFAIGTTALALVYHWAEGQEVG